MPSQLDASAGRIAPWRGSIETGLPARLPSASPARGQERGFCDVLPHHRQAQAPVVRRPEDARNPRDRAQGAPGPRAGSASFGDGPVTRLARMQASSGSTSNCRRPPAAPATGPQRLQVGHCSKRCSMRRHRSMPGPKCGEVRRPTSTPVGLASTERNLVVFLTPHRSRSNSASIDHGARAELRIRARGYEHLELAHAAVRSCTCGQLLYTATHQQGAGSPQDIISRARMRSIVRLALQA